MENLTEIVEEVQPLKKRKLTWIQLVGRMSSNTHQDDGFDDVDINIILEECMRNVDQHSSFVFSDIVTYKGRG